MNLNILKNIPLLLPILIMGCGGSGTSSASAPVPTVQGQLELSNADSQLALGGTHEYMVNLVGSANLPNSVAVNVTSSDSNVASIESNSCASQGLYNTQERSNTSCSFYVKGNTNGSAIIQAVSNNYALIQESVTVARQWGTFSSEITDADGFSTATNILSFGSGGVYTYTKGSVFFSTGYGWSQVGGESVVTDGFDVFKSIASDDSHVCVALEKQTENNGDSYKVKCSFNNGVWQDFPDWIPQVMIEQISIFNGNLYVLGNYTTPIVYYVESCPINDCNSWQQKGIPFLSDEIMNVQLFESTSFIFFSNNSSLYYQAGDGYWQKYGNYKCSTSSNVGDCYIAASESGVAIMPINEESSSYFQSIYYNSLNNLGGDFMPIGHGLEILESSPSSLQQGMVMTNNDIYLALTDGNIYTSNNVSNSWSPWLRVGNNNPSLYNIYYNNNELYSVDISDESHSQIYIYPLD